MNTRHDLRSLIDDVLGDDPKSALIALRQLNEEMIWIEQRVVATARTTGWSWRPIARLLGVDHTSLSRRLRYVDCAPKLRPVAEPAWGEADQAQWFRQQRDTRLASELKQWEESPFDLVPW